jgi:protein gp37
MADHSKIEWTETTWNVASGCTKVSAGCDHCYIERTPPFRMAGRRFDKPGVGGTTGVTLRPERLGMPLRWRKPRRVFVNSLADLFHEAVPDQLILDTFAVMALTPRHTYQLLTKRPARMRSMLSRPDFQSEVAVSAIKFGEVPCGPWPMRHVWLGTSVESQQWADIRIPALLGTPAAVRWLSCEPLLGPVNLQPYLPRQFEREQGGYWVYGTDPLGTDKRWMSGPAIGWVVLGGESGPGARPMELAWAESLVAQCQSAEIPAFMKQLGSRWGKDHHDINRFPERLRVREYPQAVTD